MFKQTFLICLLLTNKQNWVVWWCEFSTNVRFVLRVLAKRWWISDAFGGGRPLSMERIKRQCERDVGLQGLRGLMPAAAAAADMLRRDVLLTKDRPQPLLPPPLLLLLLRLANVKHRRHRACASSHRCRSIPADSLAVRVETQSTGTDCNGECSGLVLFERLD